MTASKIYTVRELLRLRPEMVRSSLAADTKRTCEALGAGKSRVDPKADGREPDISDETFSSYFSL